MAPLRLFDHVTATFQPPSGELRPETGADLGRRGVFQVVGVISKDDGVGHVGELAMMPRDMRDGVRFGFHRCPLSHLANVSALAELAGP